MTNPTTTAQATVLTDEQLGAIANDWRWHVDHDPNNTIPTWLLLAMPHLLTSHRALTEQVRVLREAMAAIVAEATPTDYPDNNVTVFTILDEYIDDARSALAALEGDQP